MLHSHVFTLFQKQETFKYENRWIDARELAKFFAWFEYHTTLLPNSESAQSYCKAFKAGHLIRIDTQNGIPIGSSVIKIYDPT